MDLIEKNSIRLNNAGEESTQTENTNDEDEVTDDLARMYLREIGKVSLLTAVQERELSGKIEQDRYLGKLEKKYKRYFTATEIVIDLITRLCKLYPTIEVIE